MSIFHKVIKHLHILSIEEGMGLKPRKG